MPLQRRIARRIATAPPVDGFAGAGHTVVEVVPRGDFASTNPFIVLMDDRIEDRGDARLGQAHPHAGIETITFILEGSLRDGDAAPLSAGDVQWMTAGSGIIHDEDVTTQGNLRLLQAWLILPKHQRWATPGFQNLLRDAVPVRREPGAELRLYSGGSGGLKSPTRNHVPVTLTEIRLKRDATIEQDIPASYNGFIYVLVGSAEVGEPATQLDAGEVGWLDRPDGGGESALRLTGGADGARLVLYSGQPLDDANVVAGPFSADSKEEVERKLEDYRAGRFARLSQLACAGAES